MNGIEIIPMHPRDYCPGCGCKLQYIDTGHNTMRMCPNDGYIVVGY